MNGQQLKEKVRSGGVVYGTMLSLIRNPRWSTPMGALGLDFVINDSEHNPRDRSEISDLLAGLSGTGLVPLVRIPYPQYHLAAMALDAGAQGVLAPYCETVDEVKEVVGAARWRNLKGAFLSRAMDTGEFPSEATKSFLEERNRNNVCIIGIESVPAIDNLPDILRVEGIDAIFVGPNDLTTSLGVPGQVEHPAYVAAVRQIIGLCKERNTPVLVHHQTLALTTRWLREGARFVLFSSDTLSLQRVYREDFSAIKAVGEELEAGAA